MLSGLLEQETQSPSTEKPDAAFPERWQLSRGGIVNVYQYGNEVLHFGGGRLLLRGANGAGKTTAMNMLLPFLLVARLRGLDAAGEQSGTQILKSWMLDGHTDPQPGGYLWVEFRRGHEFFACGCGLKANRSTGTVKLWWFATSKRPGLDFLLLEDNVPLLEGQLRACLEGGQVFEDRHRRDYRRLVEKRLFGGVPIDQHIRLINKVRNPRIGDRIDVEIPQLLKEALPQLRDRILDDVGGSLDELEEHHREVADLKRTSKELDGILGVYRSYCFSWLKEATDRGSGHLEMVRRVAREQEGYRRAADTAKRKVKQLKRRIAELEQAIRDFSSSISALKSSSAYRNIRELDTKRELVKTHQRRVAETVTLVSTTENRLQEDTGYLEDREADSRRHLESINHRFSEVATVAHRHRVEEKPPRTVCLSQPGTASTFDRTRGEIDQFEVGLRRRGDHIGVVRTNLKKVRDLEETMRYVEERWKAAKDRAVGADRKLRERTEGLSNAILEWTGQAQQWANRVTTVTADTPQQVADIADGQLFVSTRVAAETERGKLAAEIDELIARRRQMLSPVEQELSDIRRTEEEARVFADKWVSLTEPDLPRLAWQTSTDYCLADLVDFFPSLSRTERAGLEAALQASGLLSARPGDQSVVLANGELVAIPSTPVSRPLSHCLTVQIPTRFQHRIDTAALVTLLGSLSTDPSDSEAPGFVSTDGTFRVGLLRGRHFKEHPEFVGKNARQATLDRGRQEANSRLEEARVETMRVRNLRDKHKRTVCQLEDIRKELPSIIGVVEAIARLNEAQEAVEKEDAHLSEHAKKRVEAKHALLAAEEQLRATAMELFLPHEEESLERVRDDLHSAERDLGESRRLLKALRGSVDLRDQAAQRREDSERALADAHDSLTKHQEELRSQQEHLRALEASVGEDEKTINDQLRRHETDLEANQEKLQTTRGEKDEAVERRARADASAESAAAEWNRLSREGETLTHGMLEALETPGLWEALTDGPYPSDQLTSPIDLQRVLATLAEYLPPYSGEIVGADSIYKSERERRDRLGGGWDAEIRSPNRGELPLLVEVTGPSGRESLARATTAVRRKHEKASKLLADGQENQLRDLLQGVIAKEVAEKSHAAKELISDMKRHVQELSTASQIGVDIRWLMDSSLDSDTRRMVELLSMRPDLRTDEDQKTLIGLLGDHLEIIRAQNPEVGYKQALGEALDYKKWHRLQVMVVREQQHKLLGRRNDLSEGEKKFVTYLPLFAAVAASCDSIADASEEPGAARFILLDDAFAKVSEDNHAQLFGLLTDLDLDWIATSERLWGDHATIPELEIVEVIRDADLKAILLERYRWNGRSLSVPETHG